MTIGQIAQVAHGANKAYCESQLDFSLQSWEQTTLEHKEKLIAGVNFILKNPEGTPEDSHKSWLAAMKKNGWKYGEEDQVIKVKGKKDKIIKVPAPKSEIKKIHPCMVPYDKLPEDQKVKDVLFRAVVLALSPKKDKKK